MRWEGEERKGKERRWTSKVTPVSPDMVTILLRRHLDVPDPGNNTLSPPGILESPPDSSWFGVRLSPNSHEPDEGGCRPGRDTLDRLSAFWAEGPAFCF